MNLGTWLVAIGGTVVVLNKLMGEQGIQQFFNPPPKPLPPSPPVIKEPLVPTYEWINEILAEVFPDLLGMPKKPVPIYTPPIDDSLARIVEHPTIMLILGARGAGKSAVAVRIQELLRHKAAPYAVGLPSKASKLLPDWYGLADDFSTIPNNSIIYVPESYRLFHSRSTQSARGRAIGEIVNLSRHRKHTIIFDVQNAAHLDRNILSEVDLVLIKEPGAFQRGFERSQFRSSMDAARAAFSGLAKHRRKRSVWVIAPGADIGGLLFENLLPTFWTDALSRIFGDVSIGHLGAETGDSLGPDRATSRRGQRTSVDTRRETAKKMRKAGHSFREIGKTLGCSASTVFRMVNE